MTAETEVRPRRSALASARVWAGVELPPDLRRGVESAAKAAGIAPEAWLTRTILSAAVAEKTREPEPSLNERPNPEVARSLAVLLSAARARSRERQAEGSPLTLVETAPSEAEPTVPRTPAVALTAERTDRQPTEQLPTLYYAAPQPGRRGLALTLLGVAAIVAFGACAFYIRYGGTPSAVQPVLTVALPRTGGGTAPVPKPESTMPQPTAAVSAPAPSPDATAPSPTRVAPQPASSAPAIPAPSAPAAPAPTEVAAPAPIPPVPPPSPPAEQPAPQPTAAAAPQVQTAAAANPAPSPAPATAPSPPETEASAPAQPPPPAASTAAALPPGVGPRVQPPPAPREVVIGDYNLGVRYAFGNGVKQDYKKAAELFLKAAMQGLPDAQYNLGALYDNGLGVPKDPVRAVIWYHSAAEQNHPSAELNLGLAYANGTGVAQDYAEAARWFRKAAEQGVVTAQYNLAALYANGRGVEQSHVDAYAWFNIAAASGDLEARDQMRRAAETMSPQQLKAARALAVKLAEGVKRPVPGTVPPAAGSRSSSVQPAGAGTQASSEATANSTAAPAAASTLAQPIDKAQVAEIQRYLARLSFDPGPANGVLTDKTAEAIRRYETDRKLKVDGEASRALLFRLKADVERLQKP